MDIHGLQKLTLLDFPGRVACTVFLQGCDLRCPFCHNGGLVLGGMEPVTDDAGLLDFLKKRRGLLDGVAITGGEPLLRRELPALLRSIKELGYAGEAGHQRQPSGGAAGRGGDGTGGLRGHGYQEQPCEIRRHGGTAGL